MVADKSHSDPIDEIYAIRRRISARYGHDARKLSDAMIERQRASAAQGRKVVNFATTGHPAFLEGTGILVACEPGG